MRRMLLALAPIAAGQQMDPNRLRAHVQIIASEAMEGRAPGTRGGVLATDYLAAQLAVAGAGPAVSGGAWHQLVPLTGVRTIRATLAAGASVPLEWLADFAGAAPAQPSHSFEAGAVFAGFGIRAPELGWDDYRGANVRGKVVLAVSGEPAWRNPQLAGSRVPTGLARPEYKFDEAFRQGALACLILPAPGAPGDSWDAVRNTWSGQAMQSTTRQGVAFAGWLSPGGAEKILAPAKRTIGELWKRAAARGFRSFDLGVRIRGEFESETRPVQARNVLGTVAGSDSALSHEAVVFTAHWDHLGMRVDGSGDAIYNGAVDNATGCAILLEIARHWAELPVRPRRSAVFLFPAAEETGHHGAEYFLSNSPVAHGSIRAVLNFDSIPPGGHRKEVITDDAEGTPLWPIVQGVAARLSLKVDSGPLPADGAVFGGGHYPFARAGIPAVSVRAGKPSANGDSGRAHEWRTLRFHQPSDEYGAAWDLASIEQIARFGLHLGLEIANAEFSPTPAAKITARP